MLPFDTYAQTDTHGHFDRLSLCVSVSFYDFLRGLPLSGMKRSPCSIRLFRIPRQKAKPRIL
jgi:hypothetical protein